MSVGRSPIGELTANLRLRICCYVDYLRGCSSIGRASALHAEGFAFKSRQLQKYVRSTIALWTIIPLGDKGIIFIDRIENRYLHWQLQVAVPIKESIVTLSLRG